MNEIIIPLYIEELLECLYSNGYEGYLVGGCVRDILSGKEPYDYDLATNATPLQMKKCFGDYRVIETGIKHGTLTVVSEGNNVEITTYRIEEGYSDNRHPDNVVFTRSLKEDLSRRDFTVNAMAYSETEGLVDYFDGVGDLKSNVLRAVGDPQKRFTEDALRILRALRFASALDFTIEEETEKALKDCKNELCNISAERIRDELLKLLTGDNVHHVLMEYADVLSVVIPEITPCVGFDQQNKYHKYDVWEHIAVSVSIAPKNEILRLTMLLHDIAKPQCFTIDEKGQGHFKGHEKLSAIVAGDILKRLKFDNKTIDLVCLLISLHYFVPVVKADGQPSEKQIKRLMNKTGKDAFFMLLDVQRADNGAKHQFCKERMPVLDKMQIKAEEIIKNHNCFSLKDLSVDGNDLKELGLSGREIGQSLDFLLNKVIDEEIPNNKQELINCLFDNKKQS